MSEQATGFTIDTAIPKVAWVCGFHFTVINGGFVKNVFCISALTATLFGAGLIQSVRADPGDVWRKPVTMDVRNLNTDDYLIQLGRAADIDIIADVTQPLDDEPPLSVRQKGVVAGMVNQLVGTREMMASPFDERTLLWWPTPNRAEIARQIRAQQNTAPTVAPLAPTEAAQKWDEYFRQQQNWDGNWENVDITVPVDELPTDLRAQVQQETRRRLAENRQDTLMQRRLSDEFWAKARLYVASIRPPFTTSSKSETKAQPQPHLIVWDYTTPFSAPKNSMGNNIVLGPLPQ